MSIPAAMRVLGVALIACVVVLANAAVNFMLRGTPAARRRTQGSWASRSVIDTSLPCSRRCE
jgi:hypothetical protein